MVSSSVTPLKHSPLPQAGQQQLQEVSLEQKLHEEDEDKEIIQALLSTEQRLVASGEALLSKEQRQLGAQSKVRQVLAEQRFYSTNSADNERHGAPLVCSTKLGTVLDMLEQMKKIKRGDCKRILEYVGYDAPLFYDFVQKSAARLYPAEPEYSDELGHSLAEICDKTSARDLADCIERIELALRGRTPRAYYRDLARDSSAWNDIAQMCGDHLELVRIQKVENEFLKDQYNSFKERMAKKPGFTQVNEQLLFHGTGKTDPAYVCLGTEGFDPRMSVSGNYGRGTYFSTTPNYSAEHYSFTPRVRVRTVTDSRHGDFQAKAGRTESLRRDGLHSDLVVQKQMLLARVACGNIHDYKNTIDMKLTRPPPLDPRDPLILCDSIRGGPFASRSSEMCMVVTYDKSQALPEVLITFSYKPTFKMANRPKIMARRMHSVPNTANALSQAQVQKLSLARQQFLHAHFLHKQQQQQQQQQQQLQLQQQQQQQQHLPQSYMPYAPVIKPSIPWTGSIVQHVEENHMQKQRTLIQQLQNEVHNLRQQLRVEQPSGAPDSSHTVIPSCSRYLTGQPPRLVSHAASSDQCFSPKNKSAYDDSIRLENRKRRKNLSKHRSESYASSRNAACNFLAGKNPYWPKPTVADCAFAKASENNALPTTKRRRQLGPRSLSERPAMMRVGPWHQEAGELTSVSEDAQLFN